ncbi:MAG: hypothetical protein AABW50_04295 [Nanoarchaeota archaeon]
MKTLYSEFKDLEERLNIDNEQMQRLNSRSYKIETRITSTKEEIKKITSEYENNIYLRRILGGENPEKIFDEVTSKAKFKLKFPWNKEERKKYNNEVEKLEEITSSYWLKINSILSLNEPEAWPIYEFSGGYFIGKALDMIFVTNQNPNVSFLPWTLGFGIVCGTLTYLQMPKLRKRIKNNRNSFTKNAKHIIEFIEKNKQHRI